MKKGPYTVTSSKTIYKNPWITVKEDSVIRPGGKEGIFGTVEYGIGVSVVPLDSKKNIFLTREYDYVLEEYGLKLPSGGVDNNEEILTAAKRELLEETGLKSEKWQTLGFVHPLTMVIKLPQYLYLAEDVSTITEKIEAGIEVITVPFEKAYQWVLDNTITHAPSCVAILKTQLKIKTL